MNKAEEMRELFSFLERKGFHLTRMSYSERVFGNCCLQWNRHPLGIRVSIDRGDFNIDIDDAHGWHALEDVQGFLEESSPSDWMSFTPERAKVFLDMNLDQILSIFEEDTKRAAFDRYERQRIDSRAHKT